MKFLFFALLLTFGSSYGWAEELIPITASDVGIMKPSVNDYNEVTEMPVSPGTLGDEHISSDESGTPSTPAKDSDTPTETK